MNSFLDKDVFHTHACSNIKTSGHSSLVKYIWMIEPFHGRMCQMLTLPTSTVQSVAAACIKFSMATKFDVAESEELVECPKHILMRCQYCFQNKLLQHDFEITDLPHDAVVRIMLNPLPGAGAQCMLTLPGDSFNKKILVPLDTIQALLVENLIEEIESDSTFRQFCWKSTVSIEDQQSHLLFNLPFNQQRLALQKKFSKANVVKSASSSPAKEATACAINADQQILVSEETLLDKCLPNLAQKPHKDDVPKCAESRQEHRHGETEDDGINVSSSLSLRDADMTLLRRICSGETASQQMRLDLAKIAVRLKVPQKLKGKKRTLAALAQDCLAHTSLQHPSLETPSTQPANTTTEEDVTLLESICSGKAASQEMRHNVAKIAVTLKVPQKQRGRKKTLRALAKDCLQTISGVDVHVNPKTEVELLEWIHSGKAASQQMRIDVAKIAVRLKVPQKVHGRKKTMATLAKDCLQEKGLLICESQTIGTQEARRNAEQVGADWLSNKSKEASTFVTSKMLQKLPRRKKKAALGKQNPKEKKQQHSKSLTQWFHAAKDTRDHLPAYGEKSLDEQQQQKRRQVRNWVLEEIRKAKQKTLIDWAHKAGLCLSENIDLSKAHAHENFLQQRLDETLENFTMDESDLHKRTQDLANLVKHQMVTFDNKTAVKLHIITDILQASYQRARNWARKCGFAKQYDIAENVEGFKLYLKNRLELSLKEFCDEDFDCSDGLLGLMEAIKVHMCTQTKINCRSLLEQPAKKSEPCHWAASRLDQIILQLENFVMEHGNLPRKVHFVELKGKDEDLAWEHQLFKHVVMARNVTQYDTSRSGADMRKKFERLPLWSWFPQPDSTYVAHQHGEKTLYQWSSECVVTAPIVCQLCGQGLLSMPGFLSHVNTFHYSYAEYRKKVLYLSTVAGTRQLAASEKRSIVQSYAHHESTSTLGSGSNNWPTPGRQTMPREEAACVICARLDWLEHRYSIYLFRGGPLDNTADWEENDSDEDMADDEMMDVKDAIPSIAAPELLDALFNVDYYHERWPLIPLNELLASAVQHPTHPHMKWLLHTRRICMQDGSQTDCAGIADAEKPCLVCKSCLHAISKKKPSMPKFSLCNDLWIGRQHPDFQCLTDGMRWLLSIARPVFRTVSLTLPYSTDDPRQVGIASNCLFVAQPTGGLVEKCLPPNLHSFQDSLVVAFTGSDGDLSKAKWAQCSRQQYQKCCEIRKCICPSFADIKIDHDRLVEEFPAQGVPHIIQNCCCKLEASSNFNVQQKGPASIPSLQADAMFETNPESDTDSLPEVQQDPETDANLIPEQMIATDARNTEDPVACFAVFKDKVQQIEETAKNIVKNERVARLQCEDGSFIRVPDAGGRHVAEKVLQDVHQAARNFSDRAQTRLESIAARLEHPNPVTTQALRVPTGEPLNMFAAATWACAFTEFFFGDGTPGLDRKTPLLYHEWAAALQEREELEYGLLSDTIKYKAVSPSRFVKPDILACMHDGIRRLGIITGARMCLSRAGFRGDVANIAKTSVNDFISAISEETSATNALARNDITDSARACLRALLFATSNVAGTEGYRVRQRHLGNAMNILFHPCTLFFTLNFSDTRSPIVLKLHEGPQQEQACRRTINLYTNEIQMPSLRSMHEKISQNPRAQGRFFLLKHELFLRHVLGLGIFHFGQKSFEMRLPQEDSAAASLQPCLVFPPTAGFGLGEAQARGFEHTHNKLHAATAAEAEFFKKLLQGSDASVESKIQAWRDACINAATTIAFESATEIGRQLQIQLPLEPFTSHQQKKTRYDGGTNPDGTIREHMPLQPSLKPKHIEVEMEIAKKESRQPRPSYDIPLTSCPHSVTPPYRLLQSFASENYDNVSLPEPGRIPFDADENVFLLQDGTKATPEHLQKDAKSWAATFARDAFALHILNHDHACTQTCGRSKVKGTKKQASSAKAKLGACRFGFDHIVELVLAGNRRRVRRQGKSLVDTPHVVDSEEAKEHGKIQVRRTHPFRSCSSDVAQVLGRSNIDIQYTPRIPVLQPQSSHDIALTNIPEKPAWARHLKIDISSPIKQAVSLAVVHAYRAAHCADFYITKYASKALQTFSPLMKELQAAMERLQADERKESDTQVALDPTGSKQGSQKKTASQRARRVLFRACLAANRSFWLSCAELYVIVSTGAAGWQTHFEKALFLSRSIYMAQEEKRKLEKKTVSETSHKAETFDIVQFVPETEACADDDANHTFAETTSIQDDYLHRGPQLMDMTLYVYAMHVKRVPRHKLIAQTSEIFFFEPHYSLFGSFAQKLRLYAAVPRLIGPTIPNAVQDEETNAMIKAILFTPVLCTKPKTCACTSVFRVLIAAPKKMVNNWSFAQAWNTSRTKIEQLADQAQNRDQKAQKQHSIADCCELRSWYPENDIQTSLQANALRTIIRDVLLQCRLPLTIFDSICRCLCVVHEATFDKADEKNCSRPLRGNSLCTSLHPGFHPHQPFLAEYCARISRRVATNIDLIAEARIKPKKPKGQQDTATTDSEGDQDMEAEPLLSFAEHPNDTDEENIAFDDSDLTDIKPKFPLSSGDEVTKLVLRMDALDIALKSKRPTAAQKTLCKYYEFFKSAITKKMPPVQAPEKKNNLALKTKFADALQTQRDWITNQKRFPGMSETILSSNHDFDANENVELELVDLPQNISPGRYAWELLQASTATEDQIDFVALIAQPMEKMWAQKVPGDNKLKATNPSEMCRLIGLGGGGCGKSWMLNQVVAPLITRFFEGDNAYVPVCATNAGARHIRGRTLHVAAGLTAKTSLKISALNLTPELQRKMKETTKNIACLAIDEISQVSAPLFHAAALRFSLARESTQKLKLEKYLQRDQSFGRCFAVLLLGDFLQLPPVPETTSLLQPVQYTTYEQQQARALLQTFDQVFQFNSSKRFTDPHLIEILQCMRTGGTISDSAWKALQKTVLRQEDPRLLAAGDFYECAYSWDIVSLGQQLRPRQSACLANEILYYIQAIDMPERPCNRKEHLQLLQTASLSNTQKLMGMLPIHIGQKIRLTKKICAPELVQEREGTVVGIEFRSPDIGWTQEEQEKIKEIGHYVCQALPLAIYVKIDDFDTTVLPNHPGVIALQPESAKFEALLGKEKLVVKRTQFAIAPAKVKTIHTIQGATAKPGLIAHWSLPPQLGPNATWLSRYVLLSRVPCLQTLLSVGLPSREELEQGPPPELQERLQDLFESKILATQEAARKAREFLKWPCRL